MHVVFWRVVCGGLLENAGAILTASSFCKPLHHLPKAPAVQTNTRRNTRRNSRKECFNNIWSVPQYHMYYITFDMCHPVTHGYLYDAAAVWMRDRIMSWLRLVFSLFPLCHARRKSHSDCGTSGKAMGWTQKSVCKSRRLSGDCPTRVTKHASIVLDVTRPPSSPAVQANTRQSIRRNNHRVHPDSAPC